jgi:hypothetical protein
MHLWTWSVRTPVAVYGLLLLLAAPACSSDKTPTTTTKDAVGDVTADAADTGTADADASGQDVDTLAQDGDVAAQDADTSVQDADVAPGDGVDAADTGPGTVTNKVLATGGAVFVSPFDAAPDPNGLVVYFTALAGGSTETAEAGVYSVSASGSGAATALLVGAPLVVPVGVAVAADSSLFIADTAGGSSDSGAIFHIVAGKASTVVGTEDTSPAAIAIQGATVYFVGMPAEGSATLWSMPVDGSATPKVLVAGLPLTGPAGLAVSPNGDVYVADDNHIVKVVGAAATTLAGTYTFGFPAGMAVSLDGTGLLVSVLSAGHSAVLRVDLTTFAATPFVPGLEALAEPAGLHRAGNATIYAWVDAGENGNGAIHLFTK